MFKRSKIWIHPETIDLSGTDCLSSIIFTEAQNGKQNSELHTFNKRYQSNRINKHIYTFIPSVHKGKHKGMMY